jgi:hypothetical protein
MIKFKDFFNKTNNSLKNKDLVILIWNKKIPRDFKNNDFYILQKHDGNKCVLYNGYKQDTPYDKYARILTEEEKEYYVYNDLIRLSIYDKKNNHFLEKYFSDLDKIENCESMKNFEKILHELELKRLQKIDKFKDIDPLGEEDWEEE